MGLLQEMQRTGIIIFYLYDFCRFARGLESFGFEDSALLMSATRRWRSYSRKVFFSAAEPVCSTRAFAMQRRAASAWLCQPPPMTVIEMSTFFAWSSARMRGSDIISLACWG